ncbi:MAG: hypothetical protein K9I92_01750 [Chitinophagaceae bacterium]|nr:hypothetical protein [Chitinophagaceae bacterium]
MKKVLFAFFLAFSLLVCWLLVDQYLLCPRYSFADPHPFRGDKIINPYEGADFQDVSTANFHAHTKSWGGLTNGKGNSSDVWKRYDSLGHTFHAVSQYHSIDTFNREKQNYVPVYEHGYNLKKTHQLVIGAKRIVWKDYIFPQTLHNKQFILHEMAKDTGNLVVLNHPAVRSGYDVNDLKLLHYYDHIELLNPSAQSISHWDTALTAGKKIFVLGNDDNHNIFNDNAIGRFTTLIFGASFDSKKMIDKMKKGQSVAVWLPQIHNETLANKRTKLHNLRSLFSGISVVDSMLAINLTKEIAEIRVIGNHGQLKLKQRNISSLSFPFSINDPYLRVELSTEDGTILYLNPIYRDAGDGDQGRNMMATNFISRDRSNPLMESFALASMIGLFVSVRNVRKRKKMSFKNMNIDTTGMSLG